MKTLIVIGTLLVPAAVVLCRRKSGMLRLLVDALAVVSAFGFGMITAFAVIDIRMHNAVYATEVHKVFDNFLFLAFGSYLGVYMLGRLLWNVIAENRSGNQRS